MSSEVNIKKNKELLHLDDTNPLHSSLMSVCKETILDIYKNFVFTDVNVDVIPTISSEIPHTHNAFFYVSANKMNAMLCISLTQDAIINSVKKILGEENPTEKDAVDAAMELSNIIYGGLKKRMQLLGYTFGLATYQYSKLSPGDKVIGEETRYGYDFNLTSDLGQITFKVLYDTIDMVASPEGTVAKIQTESTVNSTYLDGYIPIKLVDIAQEKKINFDLFIYLRLNQKLILYKRGGSHVDKDTLERFKKFHIEYFYIQETAQSEFIDYVAKKTTAIIKDEVMAIPEKQEKLDKTAMQLITGFFNDPENSLKYLDNAQKVVEKMVLDLMDDGDPLKNLLEKIQKNLKTTETHSINVQTFSTILAMSLGYTTQKAMVSISMGALFHDIGYSKLPVNLHHKKEHEVSKEDFNLIKQHPNFGIDVLVNSNSSFPYESKLIIQQHHEHHDGTGYPKGLKGFQTYELSKIVALANDFENRLRTGNHDKAPQDVALEMWQEIKAGKVIKHEPALFKKIFVKMTPEIFQA